MHRQAMLLDLYACPAEPERWPQVLDRLCDDTGACSAVVQAFRFDGESVCMRWDATDSRTRRRHAVQRTGLPNRENPRLARHRVPLGLNRVVRDDELFDADDPQWHALQQRLAGLGMGRFIGALQPLGDGAYLGIALHRTLDDTRDFGCADERLLEQIAPHVRQACELSGRLRAAYDGLAQLRHHLDGLRCGLIVCDAQAQVQWMNRSARRLTEAQHELQLHGRTLRARRAADSARLHDQIASTGDAPCFLALGDGAGALHLALRACSGAEGGAPGSVLVAVTRAVDAADVPTGAWCRLLGVTPAEAALVATLLGGGRLEDHAQRRGVSIGTVRGQLKQVLAKTGTGRQAELVRLALSSAAAHVLNSVPALAD